MFCTNCGREMEQQFRFCPYCGQAAPALKQEDRRQDTPASVEQAAEDAPAERYDAPEPAYDEPAERYGDPEPVYDEPVERYGDPEPVYDEPAERYGDPEPVYDEPYFVYRPSEPMHGKSAYTQDRGMDPLWGTDDDELAHKPMHGSGRYPTILQDRPDSYPPEIDERQDMRRESQKMREQEQPKSGPGFGLKLLAVVLTLALAAGASWVIYYLLSNL